MNNLSNNNRETILNITRTIRIIHKGQIISLDTNSVTYLQSKGNYTYIHMVNGQKFLICKTLKTMTANLGIGFMRVHKSFLVNVRHIVARNIKDSALLLRCGGTAYVSKRKRKELVNHLRNI